MKTAAGLVEHCKMAKASGWGYVYGTFGQKLSEALLAYKIKQYPSQVGGKEALIRSKWMGKTVTDCVGLIKSYLWWDDQRQVPIYHAATDMSANGAFSRATAKGPLVSMPNRPGVCLHMPGHVGVYIGGSRVIEAKGTAYGVTETPLTGNEAAGWTSWFEMPGIDYADPAAPKTWEEILAETTGDPAGWIAFGKALVAADAAGVDLGVLRIGSWFPELVIKIYNTKR